MSAQPEHKTIDIAAVNAELESLMAEEETLKQQVAAIIKHLEDNAL